ncbi:MAG TPA: hypothetical protein VF759_06050 [Allosphingosinicella sp.]
MPRFYFHVCNGNGFTEDQEGRDFPDLEAARAEAVRTAREIMASEVKRGMLDLSSFIEIEDSEHQLKYTLGFEDVLDLTKRH